MPNECSHEHGWGEIGWAFISSGVLVSVIATVNFIGINPGDIFGYSANHCPSQSTTSLGKFGTETSDWFIILGLFVSGFFSRFIDKRNKSKHHHH